MNDFGKIIALAVMLLALSGCELFDDEDNNGLFAPRSDDPSPITDDPSPNTGNPSPPAADTYNVTVESVEMVNIDSGQPIVVDGFPLQGGELMIE